MEQTAEARWRVRLQRIGTLGPTLEVVIIRPGVANGLRFSADVLAAARARFEGAPCFCDHAGPLDRGRAGGRSVRDLVGVISEVHWDAARGELRGRLNLARHAAWVADMAQEFGGSGTCRFDGFAAIPGSDAQRNRKSD